MLRQGLKKMLFIVSLFFFLGLNPMKTVDECQKKIDGGSKNLKNVKKNIELRAVEKKKYESQKKEIEKDINALSRKQKKLSGSMRSLDAKISSNKKKEAKFAEEMRLASLRIEEIKWCLDSDVERYYLNTYALSGRYEPFGVNIVYLLSEIDHKVIVINNVYSQKQKIDGKREKLIVLRKELGGVKEDRKKEKNKYVKLESLKKKMQGDLVSKKEAVDREIRKLERSALVIETLIKKFKEEKAQAQESLWKDELARKKISNLKGRLSWPVDGRVVSNFGKQRHLEIDAYIFNNGIRIESTASRSVHAVARGRVVFAGDFTGYGSMVILDHQGGYFSIYANLEKISVKEKQTVKAFEVIGELGSVLDKETLYFEFRAKGEAVNPLAWLKS